MFGCVTLSVYIIMLLCISDNFSCVYFCLWLPVNMCICVRVSTYLLARAFQFFHMFAHVICIRIIACVHLRIFVCVCACLYVCICVLLMCMYLRDCAYHRFMCVFGVCMCMCALCVVCICMNMWLYICVYVKASICKQRVSCVCACVCVLV